MFFGCAESDSANKAEKVFVVNLTKPNVNGFQAKHDTHRPFLDSLGQFAHQHTVVA